MGIASFVVSWSLISQCLHMSGLSRIVGCEWVWDGSGGAIRIFVCDDELKDEARDSQVKELKPTVTTHEYGYFWDWNDGG